MTRIIVLDFETTGLLGPVNLPLDKQPEIIEVGAIALNEALEEVGAFSVLVKPRVLPLPPKIIEITGITDADLEKAPSFARILPELQSFFIGATHLVAHNAGFDVGCLRVELTRLDLMHKFPWPPTHTCTVEANMDLKGHRLKLAELYQMATGEPQPNAHRALDDVRSLAVVMRWMAENGRW